MRFERDVIDIDQYNEDTNPTEILKFIAGQVATYQDLDKKPEHVAKIIKRLKRMVSYHPTMLLVIDTIFLTYA